MTREERVQVSKPRISKYYKDNQQRFLDFVLDHYVAEGVDEIDQVKLPSLLQLKYHSVNDAVAELGSVQGIREVFTGFQEYLYTR